MNIDISKEQFKKIMQAFYLGDLVLHSMKNADEDNDKTYIETEQYLLSLAKDFGFAEYVEYDDNLGQYFPTPLMEHEFDNAMHKYEQDILPDQIATTLARNEVEAKLEAKEITTDEAALLLFELEDTYYRQLEQGGFSRVYIK